MNLLLTCAGRRNYLVDYFKAALAGTGGQVMVTNSFSQCSSFAVADRSFVLPEIAHPEYVARLLELCEREKITALIPLLDHEIGLLADNADRFRAINTRVVVPPAEGAAICHDKWRTFGELTRLGIRTPRTFLGLEAARRAAGEGALEFPVKIKPRLGTGSIGLIRADTPQELEVLYRVAWNRARAMHGGMIAGFGFEADMIVQHRETGQEYGLDVINDLEGNYVTTFARRKCSMRAGETDAATTVDEPQFTRLGRELSQLIRHQGVLDVDVIFDGTAASVIELNARFGGGYPFSHLAGADIPSAIIAWLQGREPRAEWLRIRPGVAGAKGILPLITQSCLAAGILMGLRLTSEGVLALPASSWACCG